MADSLCWGALGLYRAGRHDFDDDEAAFLATLCRTLADGFRRALLVHQAAAQAPSDAPGLILLDDHDLPASISATAQRWLEDLLDGWDSQPDRLPVPVLSVAASARLARSRDGGGVVQARVRVRTRSGQWLVLHGVTLSGGQTAVMLEPAHPLELAPLIVESYGLTGRESKLTQLALQGLSTNEIAATLHISPLTVQDHFKTIFDKVGVRSRRELIARVFADYYRPQLLRPEPTP